MALGDPGHDKGPAALLLGAGAGTDGNSRPIRLLDWIEKPVDFERLRHRIENAGLANLSRAPRIVCLGFKSAQSPYDTAPSQAAAILPPTRFTLERARFALARSIWRSSTRRA